ncbi:MAG: hypothetical protein GY792_12260 [Gammaproteobacteria bacterium]|nr:hypothetical protein [Gammaproteobacteria bacterium]
MPSENLFDYREGDVVLFQGETYQVHENQGESGLVAAFPSDNPELFAMRWDDECRRIGHEPLPGPTPCSTGGECPSSSS